MKISGLFASFIVVLLHCQIHGVNGAGMFQFFRGPNNNQQGGAPANMTIPDGPNGNVTAIGDATRPAGGMPPMFPPGINFVNDTCPINTDDSTPCFVGPPDNRTAGAWVCRTLYNNVTGVDDTYSACVDTNHFLETDDCGCCGGTCPSTDPCTCACDLQQSADDTNERRRLQPGGNIFGPPATGDNNFGPPSASLNGTFGPPSGSFNDTIGPPPGNFNGTNTFGPPAGNVSATLVNATGVLVQVIGDDKTMCVPTDVSYKMITGPGFFGRFECITTCP